jgi:hypothetical protein
MEQSEIAEIETKLSEYQTEADEDINHKTSCKIKQHRKKYIRVISNNVSQLKI